MLVSSLLLLTSCGKDDNSPETPPIPPTPTDSTNQEGTGIDDMHDSESDQPAFGRLGY